MDDTKLRANPHIITKLATAKKCIMCKHKLDEPIILPVKEPKPGVLQPRISAKFAFHLSDTHGYPSDIVVSWIHGLVYGDEMTPFGAKHFPVDIKR